VNCYSLFDKVFPTCGMVDYTEGIYDDPATPYDQAQLNQIQYVLDEAGCAAGVRLLDIGCGNGRLVAEAVKRGARAVGITISPEQVARCREQHLDVHLLNYRHMDASWHGQFDAVIANGPMEHFVQAEDAAAGRDDAIYGEFFQLAHRLIDPASPVRRLVNTTIHFVRAPDPRDLLRSPREFARGSDAFHYCMLAWSFGGWYPVPGQFERCASGFFELVRCEDGTQDYHRTSEHWLRRIQAEIRRPSRLPRLVWRSLPFVMRHPRQCVTMLRCMLGTQSWNWQFRGADPPTRLLRQSWRYLPSAPQPQATAPAADPARHFGQATW
jgi:cyclopropane-fatty-acyl-phospholipid synthase